MWGGEGEVGRDIFKKGAGEEGEEGRYRGYRSGIVGGSGLCGEG